MPKKYSTATKQHAMHLMKKHGNAAAVSRLTGVPARTIRDWHYRYKRYEKRHYIGPYSATRQPATAFKSNANDKDTITASQLRRRVLAQLNALTAHPKDDPRAAYYVSLTLSRLIQELERIAELVDTTGEPHR